MLAFRKEAGEELWTTTERTEPRVIKKALFFQGALPGARAFSPTLRLSAGLQIAMVRKVKHQETAVIPIVLPHYTPFLPY